MEIMSVSEKKEHPESGITLAMVTEVLELSKLQIRAVFSALWNTVPGWKEPIPIALEEHELRALILADTLEKFSFLSGAQRMLILTAVYNTLIAKKDENAVCCFKQLIFADGRYCTWTGRTGFMDIVTGDEINELPELPIETLAYNLDSLYQRGVRKIENRAGRHAKKTDAGSVDE